MEAKQERLLWHGICRQQMDVAFAHQLPAHSIKSHLQAATAVLPPSATAHVDMDHEKQLVELFRALLESGLLDKALSVASLARIPKTADLCAKMADQLGRDDLGDAIHLLRKNISRPRAEATATPVVAPVPAVVATPTPVKRSAVESVEKERRELTNPFAKPEGALPSAASFTAQVLDSKRMRHA
jgi:hypothetical protein